MGPSCLFVGLLDIARGPSEGSINSISILPVEFVSTNDALGKLLWPNLAAMGEFAADSGSSMNRSPEACWACIASSSEVTPIRNSTEEPSAFILEFQCYIVLFPKCFGEAAVAKDTLRCPGDLATTCGGITTCSAGIYCSLPLYAPASSKGPLPTTTTFPPAEVALAAGEATLEAASFLATECANSRDTECICGYACEAGDAPADGTPRVLTDPGLAIYEVLPSRYTLGSSSEEDMPVSKISSAGNGLSSRASDQLFSRVKTSNGI
ncbi:cation-transporter P-type ATPase, putative [Babesia ovis]|uniref:Cation-transporter P-type ATPase, putative n=1 Tax=Babesia ovis TaxID=5869 RepID=A0A9W5TB92_BABOV|nr:cation-transporter P-type ATPase, putative [Babesia ovis]